MHRLTLALFLGVSVLSLMGQSNALKTEKITLHLKAIEVTAGIPQSFEFKLVNATDHDIGLPMPTIQCEDSSDGAISLGLRFRPFTPLSSPQQGGGYASDTVVWPAALDRIKDWKLLHPGEALKFAVVRARLFHSDQGPGRYEVWAIYKPPFIEGADQRILEDSGFDFPRNRAFSRHLVFEER